MTNHPDPNATTGEADAWRADAQWGMRQPHPETERMVAEAYARGRMEAWAEVKDLRIERDRWKSSAQERLRRWRETTLEFRAFVQRGKAQEDRLHAAEAALAWRPIETAPRDDRLVLVWDGNVRIAAYDASCWSISDGRNWVERNSDSIDLVTCEPTHWMPFPPPPENARAFAAEAGDSAGGGAGRADAAGGVQAREIGVSGGGA